MDLATLFLCAICLSSNDTISTQTNVVAAEHLKWIEDEWGRNLSVRKPDVPPFDTRVVRRISNVDLQQLLACTNLYSVGVMDPNFCYMWKFVMFKDGDAPIVAETDEAAVVLLSRKRQALLMSDAVRIVESFAVIRNYGLFLGNKSAAERARAARMPEEEPEYVMIGRIEDSWYITCTFVTEEHAKRRDRFSFQIETDGEMQLLKKKYLGQDRYVM